MQVPTVHRAQFGPGIGPVSRQPQLGPGDQSQPGAGHQFCRRHVDGADRRLLSVGRQPGRLDVPAECECPLGQRRGHWHGRLRNRGCDASARGGTLCSATPISTRIGRLRLGDRSPRVSTRSILPIIDSLRRSWPAWVPASRCAWTTNIASRKKMPCAPSAATRRAALRYWAVLSAAGVARARAVVPRRQPLGQRFPGCAVRPGGPAAVDRGRDLPLVRPNSFDRPRLEAVITGPMENPFLDRTFEISGRALAPATSTRRWTALWRTPSPRSPAITRRSGDRGGLSPTLFWPSSPRRTC